VRRFNWFNYIADRKFTEFNPSQDDLGRMVLNPDVTVRARGVMEKCSMCVQRIQAGKLEAKKNSSKVEDGAISTACASACPTHAITFGDLNDKSSRIANHDAGDRAYRVIEDVGTRPNIVYLTKVRNKETAQA
jgi:molybdopterin-containing oxidoreductase family iron-sulfur binding subunit